ncbi:UV DNA damage endonuclease [Clostridium saccharoperbutylacetonicum]|uniref:UV DNA damage endonuclease UvsE n=1 Tax=Clostridium saccharoperbutylacetonicum N1-4(HMT) TaxID=931276 RepID=M1LT54_9CLOT|nr:UV DNA damage repair endonuclease UvsE [Clostridium saccharoperbutylacetonicum]AGF56200.1 UV DNA damage endonuclease UvsE [Clostridium saccharoperbutylacetonicum N1-4(HMT)]NRT63058.1 UV DNA damage endonuclease [Clostridium saccharoperbutylacetonicum]NSB26415.1 UV DNA damage endonuclease [Clostridium saccharoperbutylacetonicum]NSB45768.1 UV DNA damage endonuclease [Clostridium saccharoperbutylacetonicum]
MKIGYACLTIGVLNANLKSCTAKSANDEKLIEVTENNLKSLHNIIKYNIENNIKLFRISSDLIPFGSSPLNNLPWWDIFGEEFAKIGKEIRKNSIRVSMHPGQYTVLNSTSEDVVKRAMTDLNYHNKVLDCLGVNEESKIVLHIGGVYNDKKSAIKRFIDNYALLENGIKQRLVIENDDKSYNINDVLEIGHKLNIPVIFDNLHNKINPYSNIKSELYWINECKKTWGEKDGTQKIHYSQQDILKKPGSHSNTIEVESFVDFYKGLERDDIDIMLEVKDKNLSAVKCINSITKDKSINKLEEEWSRYKYKVLESSPKIYLDIRKLLKDKKEYPVVKFYNYIDEAIKQEYTIGNSINAAMHIWGYFKNKASLKEKEIFLKNVDKYEQGKISIKVIKNMLRKLAFKYKEYYLLDSYYFSI